jgi:hypothetical protein
VRGRSSGWIRWPGSRRSALRSRPRHGPTSAQCVRGAGEGGESGGRCRPAYPVRTTYKIASTILMARWGVLSPCVRGGWRIRRGALTCR